MERLNRTEILIGEDGLKKLQNAHVTVCGLGAVGSYAVEALARSGVGNLRIVDYDIVAMTNINRQLYALHSTIGEKKAAVAKKRILDINPDCHVEVFDTFINHGTNPDVIADPVDVIIDAIDSLSAKIHLIADAYRDGRYVISSMGAAGRIDANLVISGDLSETHTCPLARFVRSKLHRQGIFTGVRCIYSSENPQKIMEEGQLPHDGSRTPPVLGSISYLTGIFGLKAAYEAIDYILKNKVTGR